jgi:HlyD family secretion protein
MTVKPRIIIIAAVVALAAAGGTWACRGRGEADRPTLFGNVDIREVNLAFRTGGRIADIKVDEGSPVHAGDLIASLDPEPLQDAVANAEAAVAASGAHAAMLHQGYRSEDVAQAKARLEAAQAALKEAEQQLVRQQAMVPSGAAPQRTLDNAVSQRDQAAAQVRTAEQSLRELSVGYRKEEIAEADGQLRQAQASLETARLNLRDAQLTAPSDGVILTRAVEKGSMVAAGTPGFSLTLTSPVWARAYVNETQLGRFNSGTQVTLTTDLHPDQPYHGVVGFVSPTSEFTPKNVETADLRTALVYRLRIVVTDPDVQLRQGMPVTVRLAK